MEKVGDELFVKNQYWSFTDESDSMAVAGFKGGKGSQKPRNVGRLWKLEKSKKHILP